MKKLTKLKLRQFFQISQPSHTDLDSPNPKKSISTPPHLSNSLLPWHASQQVKYRPKVVAFKGWEHFLVAISQLIFISKWGKQIKDIPRLPDSSSREPEVFLPLSNTSLRSILFVAGSEKTSGIQGSGLEMLFKYFAVK